MKIIKISLMVGLLVLTGGWVLGCAKKKTQHSPEYGALEPQSMEATSLSSNSWCLRQTTSQGVRYELRASFEASGRVVLDTFELSRYEERGKPIGTTLVQQWKLDGTLLTVVNEEGVPATSTLRFIRSHRDRYMTTTYDDGSSDTYYSCF
jgi:hypothetical protein